MTPLPGYWSSSLSESDSSSYSRPPGNSTAQYPRTEADNDMQPLAINGPHLAADNGPHPVVDQYRTSNADGGLNPGADQIQASEADKAAAQFLDLLDLEDEDSTDRISDSTYVPSSTGTSSALVPGNHVDKDQQQVGKDTAMSKPLEEDDTERSDSSNSSLGTSSPAAPGKKMSKSGKRRTSKGKR